MIITPEALKMGSFLVIGDVMVDEYNFGTVSRISPEAPIPILDFTHQIRSPGGAANVALNLVKLGNKVNLVGRVGADESGAWVKAYLQKEGVGITGLLTDLSGSTTRKVRFATAQQSILRVDYEDKSKVKADVAYELTAYIEKYLANHQVDGVLISDYNKGLILDSNNNNPWPALLNKISHTSILCGADTKKIGSSLKLFSNFNFIKPNLSELGKSVNQEEIVTHRLPHACQKYLELSQAKSLLVTLGAGGMYHYSGDSRIHVSAVKTAVKDVTGAGDTVFAVVMQALASGLSWTEAMAVANIAASVVIKEWGTKAISLPELIRGIEFVKQNQPEYFKSETSL